MLAELAEAELALLLAVLAAALVLAELAVPLLALPEPLLAVFAEAAGAAALKLAEAELALPP